MKRSTLSCLVALWSCALAGTQAAAQGYLSFQANGPAGTTVTTGDASSYTRSSLDWDQSLLVGGKAVPNLLIPGKVTTWRDATSLNLKFAIPFKTDKKPDGNALACGDQFIVQISKNKTTATTLDTTGTNRFFRYEVVINGAIVGGKPTKREPRLAFGIWNWNPTDVATTATTSPLSIAGNQYQFTLTIPLTEIGNPTTDIGIAVALINDLGHSTGSPAVNEASGTAFPLTMGLTPESEPGLNCGPPAVALATGNWINPSTWGTGFFSLATVPPAVTFSQAPYAALSEAIRLGNCDKQFDQIVAVPSLAGWEAHQQNASNNWYLYYPTNPCRMAVWARATVAAGGVVTKRFMVVFGRPGIAPQEWYLAGVTGAVPVNTPDTKVSFVWEKPPAVTFTSHPCMKVFILKGTVTDADVDTLKGTATQTPQGPTWTDAQLNAAIGTYVDTTLSQQSAQMNFGNLTTGSCPAGPCSPIASLEHVAEGPVLASMAPFASLWALLQPAPQRGEPTRRPDGDEREWRVRIIAHGFGVADPASNKNYVYVEPIGTVGWFVPNTMFEEATVELPLDVTNPRSAESMFVGTNQIVIPAPPRRILMHVTTEAPAGRVAPHVDVSALSRYAEQIVQPGQTEASGITVRGMTKPWWQRWWWIILLIVLLVIVLVWWLK
jgi:hypothetical protein